MKLILKEYDNHDEYGTWGEWWYGDKRGSFGRSLRGMWACCDDSVWIGLETYEESITDSFKQDIVSWRRKVAKFNRWAKKWEAD